MANKIRRGFTGKLKKKQVDIMVLPFSIPRPFPKSTTAFIPLVMNPWQFEFNGTFTDAVNNASTGVLPNPVHISTGEVNQFTTGKYTEIRGSVDGNSDIVYAVTHEQQGADRLHILTKTTGGTPVDRSFDAIIHGIKAGSGTFDPTVPNRKQLEFAFIAPCDGKLSNLFFYANGGLAQDDAAVMVSWINGATGNLLLEFQNDPSGTAKLYKDVSQSDIIVAGDLISLKLIIGSTTTVALSGAGSIMFTPK